MVERAKVQETNPAFSQNQDLERRHFNLLCQILYLALGFLNSSARLVEMLAYLQCVMDGRGFLKQAQILRFFCLLVPERGLHINIFLAHVARCDLLRIQMYIQPFDFLSKLVELSGGNTDQKRNFWLLRK